MDKNKYWEVFSANAGKVITSNEKEAIEEFHQRVKDPLENLFVSITESRVLGIFTNNELWIAPEATDRIKEPNGLGESECT